MSAETVRRAPARDPDASMHGKPAADAATGSTSLTAEELRLLAENTGVQAIMSRNVVCLAPEAEVHAVTEMFLDRDFSSAPVVDGQWMPLGVVSKTDLLRYFSTGVQAQGSLRQSHRMPRTGPRLHVPARVQVSQEDKGAGPTEADVQVADVTVPYVLSLHEEAPISVAAALMAYEGVHRLPIVSTGGEVVGVVSTLDIVRWLAQAAGLGPESMG